MDSISDPQKLAAYGKLAIPAVAPFCARMLARGNAVAAYENGLKEVTIEYTSLLRASTHPGLSSLPGGQLRG
jgi:uncharacterized protein (DUF1330 family)